jgi:hypothetical protein
MPRQSHRHKAISAARKKFKAATSLLFLSQLVEEDDSISIDLTDPDPVVASFLSRFTSLNRLRKSRYMQKRTHRKSKLQDIFEDDLFVSEDGNHWLNDNEFKRKYRCSREALDKISAKIEGNDVFKKGSRGPSQLPVKHQLMCLLHFLGQEGESNASQRNQFKFSYGASEAYRKRVVTALGDLLRRIVSRTRAVIATSKSSPCDAVRLAGVFEDDVFEVLDCFLDELTSLLFLVPGSISSISSTLKSSAPKPLSSSSSDSESEELKSSSEVRVGAMPARETNFSSKS